MWMVGCGASIYFFYRQWPNCHSSDLLIRVDADSLIDYSVPRSMATSSTALAQIEQLQAQIEQLKHNAILELKSQIIETRRILSEQEAELAKLTGRPATEFKAPRIRRPSITDDELKRQILEVMAAHGVKGMNGKQIADRLNQDANRIRRFLLDNPKFLKKQGSGPGTKLFLP